MGYQRRVHGESQVQVEKCAEQTRMKLILLIVLSLVLAAQSKPYPEEESLDNITDSVADAKMEEEGELGQRIMDDLNAEKAKVDKALEVIEGEIEQTQKDQEEVIDVLS